MNGGNILNDQNEIQLGLSLTIKGALDYNSGFILGKLKRWFSGTNAGNQNCNQNVERIQIKRKLIVQYS